jgi:hypothetical protein
VCHVVAISGLILCFQISRFIPDYLPQIGSSPTENVFKNYIKGHRYLPVATALLGNNMVALFGAGFT